MGQRAAAPLPLGQHHLDALARQQADGGVVDTGIEHRLGAAAQKHHAALALPGRREDAGARRRASLRQPLRREIEHGGKAREAGDAPQNRRERSTGEGGDHRGAEPRRIRQDGGEQRARCAVHERPPVGLLDVGAGMIDQMHVVDAGRTGRHAGKARQAAVDVGRHLFRRGGARLQHVLDQVDAPARAVEFVAEQHVRRAGRRAEAAVDARAQDLVGGGDLRIGKLGEGEAGLHDALTPPRTCGRG